MHGFRTFFMALVPILLGGCIAPQNPSEAARLNAWMTRWADVVQHKPIQRTAFTKNDRPMAILQNMGWKDQTVYVEFIHVDSNKSVFHEGTGIARNELKYIGPTQPLAAGTYYLKVTPQNSPPLMQTFAVYGD
jgi:hypothetical protein